MGNNPLNLIDPDGSWTESGANWRRSLASFFGYSPSEVYDSGGEYGFNISTPEGFAFMFGKTESENTGWNNPFVRFKTGDYVFFSFDMSVIAGAGVKETPIGWVIPLRGENAFEIYTYHDVGVGAGVDASSSFNVGKALLLGPVNQVTIRNFEGYRHQFEGGYGPVSVAITLAPAPPGEKKYAGVVAITGSVGGGAGIGPFTGNYNYGKTWVPNREK